MKVIERQVDPTKLQGVEQQCSHRAGEPFPAAQDVVVELERCAPKLLVWSLLTIHLLLLELQGAGQVGVYVDTHADAHTRMHRMLGRQCNIQYLTCVSSFGSLGLGFSRTASVRIASGRREQTTVNANSPAPCQTKRVSPSNRLRTL